MTKKSTLFLAVLLILLAGAIAIYYYLPSQPLPSATASKNEEAPSSVSVEKSVETSPETRQVLDIPAEPLELPALDSSDNLMGNALANLISNKALMRIFNEGQLIRNIVVTIDNLPRKQASMRVMPIKKAPGKFIVNKSEESITISPNNSERYADYLKFAEELDANMLVENYINLYPLFQQSYEEIGYPDQYFNDRLLMVIDHLLATPEITEPVLLVQPKFYYQYADNDLESRSIGQRILMRIGKKNEAIIKTKLQAIKQALLMHMHEKKLE